MFDQCILTLSRNWYMDIAIDLNHLFQLSRKSIFNWIHLLFKCGSWIYFDLYPSIAAICKTYCTSSGFGHIVLDSHGLTDKKFLLDAFASLFFLIFPAIATSVTLLTFTITGSDKRLLTVVFIISISPACLNSTMRLSILVTPWTDQQEILIGFSILFYFLEILFVVLLLRIYFQT